MQLFTKPYAPLLCLLCSISLSLHAQVLAEWTFEQQTQLSGTAIGGPFVVAEDAAQAGIGAGLGANPSSMNGGGLMSFQGFGSPATSSPSANHYMQVELFCPAGDCDFTGATFELGRDVDGPARVQFAYSDDPQGTFTNMTPNGVPISTGYDVVSINLPAPVLNQQRIYVRVYPYQQAASAPLSRVYLDRVELRGQQSLGGLPLNFLSVQAERQHDQILVTWHTADERNVSHFEVRTGFGESLRKAQLPSDVVAFVSPSSATDRASYAVTYTAPHQHDQYLQVVAVDHDGAETKSVVLAVDGHRAESWLAVKRLAPRTYQVQAGHGPFGKTLHVVGSEGRVLKSFRLQAHEVQQLVLDDVPPGIVYLTDGTHTQALTLN